MDNVGNGVKFLRNVEQGQVGLQLEARLTRLSRTEYRDRSKETEY
jgi:hypothetical protein